MTTIDAAPLFSIITITRNNLDGLKRTGESIANQSFFDYEWIVIDGDSTDGTKDHLPLLPALCLSEPDKGIYDAMNKGIDRAGGQHLLFLNAGDALADMDILSTLAKVIFVERPDFIYGDALETGGLYKKARRHDKIDWGMFTHHQAMIYKRKTVKDLRYDSRLQIAADYGFTAFFLKRAKSIHYIPCALCVFENGGVSEQRRKLGRKEQFLLRRTLGISNFGKNILIYTGQGMTALLREQAPCLYKKLKTGSVPARSSF